MKRLVFLVEILERDLNAWRKYLANMELFPDTDDDEEWLVKQFFEVYGGAPDFADFLISERVKVSFVKSIYKVKGE